MMKKLLFLFILLFVSHKIHSQNYIEGYYVTNKNDTIYGLIGSQSEALNTQECKFKATGNSQEEIFTPEDIVSYRLINGIHYISKTVEVDKVQCRLFLRYLVQGKMNLYSFVNNEGLDYFLFENENGEVMSITQEEDKLVGNHIYSDNKYKGALNRWFKDYDVITKGIRGINFNQRSMIGIVKKYHEATCDVGEICVVYENKNLNKDSAKLKFSVYGGTVFSSYDFNIYYRKRNSYTKKTVHNTSPIIGLQANLPISQLSKPLSLQLGASLMHISGETGSIEIDKYTSSRLDYKATVFTTRLGLKYSFWDKRVQPFIGAGFSYSAMINPSATEYRTINFYPKSNEELDYSLRDGFWGYYGSAGVDYRIGTNSFVFAGLAYENCFSEDATKTNGKDKLRMPLLKLGYIF